MRILLFCLCVCVSTVAVSQQFQGSIKWSVRLDYTDSLKKAQMVEARNKLRDPLGSASLVEHSRKLTDPEISERKDPHTKKELEAARKATRNLGLYPAAITASMLKGNTRLKYDSIFPDYEILLLRDSAKTFAVDKTLRQYVDVTRKDRLRKPKSDSLAVVKKTSETAEILGYRCTKYTVTANQRGSQTSQEIWSTEEIKGFDKAALTTQPIGRVNWILDRIPGAPLRLISKNRDGVVRLDAVDVSTQLPVPGLFIIPKDYIPLKVGKMVR
jgi:hypothetical protein